MFQETTLSSRISLETEFKYFVGNPSASLIHNLALNPEQKFIGQYLFSLEQSQALLLPLMQNKCADQLMGVDTSKFKGRVRQIDQAGETKYVLGLKGPKEEEFKKLNIVSKPEIEVEISVADFKKLKKLADKGYILKHRTPVPCTVEFQGKIYKFIAEFDRITNVNGFHLRPKFLMTEIEVPEANAKAMIKAIRGGKILLNFAAQDLDFKLAKPIEVKANSEDRIIDLSASRKLINNVDSITGPSRHLRKYFDLK